MILRGLDAINAYLTNEHQKNLDEWCKQRGLPRLMAQEVKREYWRRNTYRVNGGERDFCDQDYPGRGLEFEFFEIPN